MYLPHFFIQESREILAFRLILFCFFLLAGQLQSQIIITESMFDADTLEHHNEFVELWNKGSSPIHLQGFQLGDDEELDHLMDAGFGLELLPFHFAVILDPSYFENSTVYDSLIPDSALIVTIDDGSFGRFGWSNTKQERVILKSPAAGILQSYRYTTNNKPGFSDEKILLKDDNSDSNWGNSSFFRGTPGDINSISPLARDISIDSIWIDPQFPLANQAFDVFALVRNKGIEMINDFRVIVYRDHNMNGLLDAGEEMNETSFSSELPYNEKTILSCMVDRLSAGNHQMGICIEMENDNRLQNNNRLFYIRIENHEASVVINEIMFRPKSGFPEWVELFNSGRQEIDFENWMIADARSESRISKISRILGPSQYLVISQDSIIFNQFPNLVLESVIVLSAFPSLNNDFDELVLKSFSGRIIDQVSYCEDWFGRETQAGVSLERINPLLSSSLPENWSGCVHSDGGTPVRQNSIYVLKKPETELISIGPNPFSPDGDGFEDITLIEYLLPFATGYLTIDIFDLTGRKIIRLADFSPVGFNGYFIWNGRDDRGRMARMGLYIVLVKVFEPNTALYKEMKKTLVLTKK